MPSQWLLVPSSCLSEVNGRQYQAALRSRRRSAADPPSSSIILIFLVASKRAVSGFVWIQLSDFLKICLCWSCIHTSSRWLCTHPETRTHQMVLNQPCVQGSLDGSVRNLNLGHRRWTQSDSPILHLILFRLLWVNPAALTTRYL